MPRLRRSDCAAPGLTRRRHGDGFVYLAHDGSRVSDPATIERIEGLVLPPAWRDVWICPWPNGHIQAVGTDAAGRRQYRYHDAWREQRDRAKHERVLDFASRLPAARERIAHDLAGRGLTRDRTLACAVRLLDLGFFRIGSEEYAEQNQTYGLATIRRDHVTVARGVVTFDYPAKHGKQRIQTVADPAVCDVVAALKRRRSGGEELLAYRAGDRWQDVRSEDVNDYLRAALGGEFTAKDFRTWHATVLMAVALAVSVEAPRSETGRKRAVTRAVKEVADYLGNTPAVCRSSYIDPRVIDRYGDAVTIADTLADLGADAGFGQLATQGAIEEAVLQLLREPRAPRRRTARPTPKARSRASTRVRRLAAAG
ncbi:MAG TPA: DNA topoisomerase IB [Mycobacteriales bacterium]|nr:DNA topoisomerase IB [Mycobacteriales bacterium]